MHITAMANGKLFFDTYVQRLNAPTVVEIGSQDVNGSLREVCPPDAHYIGLDFVEAKGVDIVLTDPYELPVESESADVVVSSSCFEHSEMFWLVFNEVMRILKPGGVFYLNVPSNGAFHRYPVDCWRFYPDAANALVAWGKRSGYKPALLESYTAKQHQDIWNDFVAIFVKDECRAEDHPNRILHHHKNFENGWLHGQPAILNEVIMPEDRRCRDDLSQRIHELESHINALEDRLKKIPILEDRLKEVPLLERKVQEMETVNLRINDELAATLSRIHAIESSTSWRVTAPMRAAKRLFSGHHE